MATAASLSPTRQTTSYGALAIVKEIVTTRAASPPFPNRFHCWNFRQQAVSPAERRIPREVVANCRGGNGGFPHRVADLIKAEDDITGSI